MLIPILMYPEQKAAVALSVEKKSNEMQIYRRLINRQAKELLFWFG